MKVELTRQEMLDIQAHSNAMQALQVTFQPLLDLFNKHAEEQERVATRVRKRIKDLPDTPLGQWDFSQVDPVTYEGSITVPGPPRKRRK